MKEETEKLVAPALKKALNGGRRFGTAEHRVMIGLMLDRMAQEIINDAEENGKESDADAIVERWTDPFNAVCNISAFQQYLDANDIIDRQERGKKAKVTSKLKELLS